MKHHSTEGAWTRGAILSVLLGFLGCSFGINPDQNLFSCEDEKDCGKGYECRPRVDQSLGLCFPEGACSDELCDGKDNDCNGATDEGFDLLNDSANCGECGRSCNGGSCQDGGCS